ncbi:MAG: hypothetical protein KC443_23920 [Anaerolineales bacterium]|nr:hypothetical protein [Anaerolineales bacterium]
MTRQEMPIFTRTFDFLAWLLPMTNHFPRAHRHTFTQRLLDAAFDLRERARRPVAMVIRFAKTFPGRPAPTIIDFVD